MKRLARGIEKVRPFKHYAPQDENATNENTSEL
jgi:hypothetical protein